MTEIEILAELLELSIPLYTSVHLGTLKQPDGTEFHVVAGLDRNLVRRLREHSLDETDTDIQKNTSDSKRFGPEGAYEEWYEKGRTPFALVHKLTGDLAALAWFGPKPIGRKSLRFLSEAELKEEGSQEVSEWHTIVYRSYKPYRGKGLMTPFMRFAMDEYLKFYPDAKLWAGLSVDNAASVALATKLGFKKSEEHSDPEKRWCAMVLEQ
ncbi:GNAT family N-acetyltransferase [Candidatus Kaiserbacteria bacterium]|nr:GNAT family N-acetyltransferase [Candidatus Kaiserbacteria bacterium]